MKPKTLILPVLVAAIVAVVALAAGKSAPKAPAASAASSHVTNAKVVDITIKGYAYEPAAVTVKVGTKIVVTNRDATAHTLTAKSGAFDSGTIQQNKTMSFTVTKAGVYPYYCQFHAFMLGTLTVVAS